jgi:hypothetical protein
MDYKQLELNNQYDKAECYEINKTKDNKFKESISLLDSTSHLEKTPLKLK